MTSALAIALATVCMASLAGAWWATRQIAAMAKGLAGLVSSMSSLQTELLTCSLDRDRARFELRQTSEAYATAQTRLADLEDLLDEHSSSLASGLASDDVRGRLLRRAQAMSGSTAGGSLSANAGKGVSATDPPGSPSAGVRPDLPDV